MMLLGKSDNSGTRRMQRRLSLTDIGRMEAAP